MKNLRRKTRLFPKFSKCFLFAFSSLLFLFLGKVYGQNSFQSGDGWGTGWGSGVSMSASAGSSLIYTTTNSLGGNVNRYFRFYGTGTPCGEYQPNNGGNDLILTTSQTYTSANMQCGNAKAFGVLVPNTTDNWVFKSAGSAAQQIAVFRVQGAVRQVSSVTQNILTSSVTAGQSVTVTANLDGALSTGQAVYLRYTNNNYSTSTVVQMTGSGTSYTASIPGATNTAGANVSYYVFTSTDTGVGSGTTQVQSNGSNADFYTINLNNNSGSNYSYTVNTPATIYLHNFNDITTNTTAGQAYTTSPTATTGTPTGVFATNLSSSSWTNGGGSSFIVAGGSSGNSLAVSSVASTPYTLTFNVATGYSLSITSYNYWRQSSQSTNSVTSITVNGTTITSGSVAIPTTGAAIGTTNVANTVSGLTGTVTVVINFGGGTGSFRLDDFTLTGNVVATPAPPSLTTPTATSITNNSATLGATITSNNGSAITARGTSFKTTSPVAATDNQLAEGGTAVSSFSHSRTGLSAQTRYYYVGYATNGNGTGISSEGNFYTLSNPATAQPATFTATAGSSSLTANWGTATYPSSGATKAGYLLIYSTGTPSLVASPNGLAPANAISNGTQVTITETTLPTVPSLTANITGLTNGTTYNLLIVPYTWDGTNAGTYNYFTTGAKTCTGTPAAISYTWNGGTSGSWTTSANWTPNGVPTTGDNVTFATSGNVSVTSVPTVSLTGMYVTAGNVTLAPASTANAAITLSNTGTALNIASSAVLNLIGNSTNSRTISIAYSGTGNTATIAGTLNLQNNASAAASYSATNSATTVSGTLSNNNATGTITSTASNLTISGTGKFQLAGLATVVPTATWSTNSTLEFANSFSTSTIVTGLAQSFSNVTVNATGVTGSTTLIQCNGALTSIGKDLTITSTGAGGFSLQQGTTLVTTTIGGSYNQTGGNFDFSNGSSNGSTNVNISGNISVSGSGTISTNGTVRNGAFVLVGSSPQTVNFATPANVTYTNFTVNSGATMKLASNIILNNSSTTNYNGTILVNNGGIFDAGSSFTVTPASTTSGGSTFTLSSGATLITANSSGVTGSIPVSSGLTTSYNSGANYTFNGSTQNTGTFTTTPTANTVNTLEIAGGTVTNTYVGTGALNVTALKLTSGTLNVGSGKTINIANNGTVSKTSGDFATTSAGTINFAGTGTVTGAVNFYPAVTQTPSSTAGVNYGTSRIKTSLTLNANSFVSSAPFYDAPSTLIYNTGGTYGRNVEFGSSSGQGYPYNVTVQNGTTLDLSANSPTVTNIAGTLTLGNNSTAGSVTLGASSVPLKVGGDVIIGNGFGTNTLTLSSASGGDLYMGGNWTRNATGVFAPNNRAVFFNGGGPQTITGATVFDYLLLSQTTSSTVTLNNDITINKVLTYGTGKLVTGSNVVIMGAAASDASPSSTSYIYGNQRYPISSAGSKTFNVGDANTWAPVSANFTAVSSAGTLTASTAAGDHSQIASSSLDASKSVNRTWTLANGGGLIGTYNPTFNFVAGDLDSGTTPGNLILGNYFSSAWSYPAVGAANTTNLTATGVNTFGDFQLAECRPVNLVITNPAAVCSPNTVDLTAASITAGSSSGLVYTYWTDSNATVPYTTPTQATAGTYYIKGTSSTGCFKISSVIVTVTPLLSSGTISGSGKIFIGGTTTLTSTGDSGGVWSSSNPSVATINPSSGLVTASTVNTGTVTISYTVSNSCGSSSATFPLTVTDVTTWNGSAWDFGVPSSGVNASLASAYTVGNSGQSSFASKNLTVENTGLLTIPANQGITVNGDITTADNKIVIESDGSLLQTKLTGNNNSNNKIIAKRKVTMKTLDYTYWSSPVSGQLLRNTSSSTGSTNTGLYDTGGFSAGTPNNRIYQYNEPNDLFLATTDAAFVAAKGYAIRGKASYGTTLTADEFSFNGVMNNGALTIGIQKSKNTGTGGTVEHGYNMIGNPYPSHIDFLQFYNLDQGNGFKNSDFINGKAWFWTNVPGAPTTQGGSSYTANNYAILTLAGGTPATGVDAGNTTSPSSAIPNQYIKVGQGFIVQMKGTAPTGTTPNKATLKFDNSVRTNNSTGNFYNAKTNGSEINRYWLNLVSPNNVSNTILVAHMDQATNNYDADYDADLLVVADDSFYSKLNVRKLQIQARANVAVADDVVPLGAKYSMDGTYKIALAKREGIFGSGQSIYLHDKILNTYTDLTQDHYSFQATKGLDESRFEIVYNSKEALSANDLKVSDFVVYRDGNDFVVKSSRILGRVDLYDGGGRLLQSKQTSEKQIRLEAAHLVSGFYIIKAQNSGDVRTKKLVK